MFYIAPLIASLAAHLLLRSRETAIIVAMAVSAATSLVDRYLIGSSSRSAAWLDAIAAAFITLPVAFIVGLIFDLGDRIVAKGTAPTPGLCTRCGYDLTGNESGICPECGKRFCSQCGNHMLGRQSTCPRCGNEKLAPSSENDRGD